MKFFQTIWAVLREFALAAIGQPSSQSSTKEERATQVYQQERLQERESSSVSAWDAVRAAGTEIVKAAIAQPTPVLKRPSEKDKSDE